MSLDGIWVLEIGGIFGWERMSTVVLEKGRYLGGGEIFSSQGTYYITDGDKVKIKLQVTQYDEHRIAWGKKRKQFSTVGSVADLLLGHVSYSFPEFIPINEYPYHGIMHLF